MYEMSNMTNNSPSNESRLNTTYDNRGIFNKPTEICAGTLLSDPNVSVLAVISSILLPGLTVLVCSFAFCALWHELTA